jgi:hypothetical protein
MVTLTHLKRPGGSITHNTHALSTHEMISQRSNICFFVSFVGINYQFWLDF